MIDDDAVESFADRTLSIACGAGWAAEAVRFLKDIKKEGIVTDQVLSKLPVLNPVNPRDVWEECVVKSSRRMARLHDVRDAGFAHFYDRNEKCTAKKYRLAVGAIESLATEKIDVPFVEWAEIDGQKRNSKSCSPLGMVAILSSLFDVSADEALEQAIPIANLVLEIGILLENLLAIIFGDSGIETEPYIQEAS